MSFLETRPPNIHPQNRQTYTEFRLNYRDTLVVVSGYSVQMRAKIIDRWQELEGRAAAPQFAIPQTLGEALRLAADLAEKAQELSAIVAEQTPKVEALDRIATAGGSFCIRDAAKALQMRPIDLAIHQTRRELGGERATMT
ncbi:phage antirepressor KilAC domain-containing protein [Cupriavidus sp. CuC1]|uniref:phage antirepressor KilAC domain-containing protein n=1 Tax=Cupriavidus sp. CuC1 TaxID=3373131 RepID=UPI0037D21626